MNSSFLVGAHKRDKVSDCIIGDLQCAADRHLCDLSADRLFMTGLSARRKGFFAPIVLKGRENGQTEKWDRD